MTRVRTVLFWCHLTCGVVAGLVILMMCVTGVALTYQRQIQWWADTRHFRADRVLDNGIAFHAGWSILAMRLPVSANAPVVVTLDRGDGGQPHLRGTLTLNAQGQVERWEGASSLTAGRRLRNFLRFAHTGEVAGLAGQTVAGIVSAAAAVLVYTGIALALRRFVTWSRRRAA